MTDVRELIERLRNEGGRNGGYAWCARELCTKAATALTAALEREEALREALEFYADHDNWFGTYTISGAKYAMNDDWSEPTEDYPDGKLGKRARNALENTNGN